MTDVDDSSGDDLRLDSEAASIFTGIDGDHLQGFLQGELIPGWVHSERIHDKLGDDIADNYETAPTDVEPEYIKTRKGLPPEGHRILRQVQVPEIEIGDYLPYLSSNEPYGSLWVQVIDTDDEQSTGSHRLLCIGGLWTDMSVSHSCRVARIITDSAKG